MAKLSKLEELRAQQAAIAAQIKQELDAQRDAVISRILSDIEQIGLSAEDLCFAPSGTLPPDLLLTNPADPKQTFTTGKRGKRPAWVTQHLETHKNNYHALLKSTS